MNTAEYFKHARSLGNFTAEDCIKLARQAEELDRAAKLKSIPQPIVVWYEVMPDGYGFCKFSKGVTVY